MNIKEPFKWILYKLGDLHSYPMLKRIWLAGALLFLVLVIVVADVIPERIAVEEGAVSDRDIIAPRTVSYVNEEKTKKLESEVLEGVADVYDMDVAVLLKSEDQVNGIFNALQNVVNTKDFSTMLPDEQAVLKHKALSDAISIGVSKNTVNFLIYADMNSVENVRVSTITFLRKYLQRGIHADEISLVKKHLAIDLESAPLNQEEKEAAEDLLKNTLKPNMILNEK